MAPGEGGSRAREIVQMTTCKHWQNRAVKQPGSKHTHRQMPSVASGRRDGLGASEFSQLLKKKKWEICPERAHRSMFCGLTRHRSINTNPPAAADSMLTPLLHLQPKTMICIARIEHMFYLQTVPSSIPGILAQSSEVDADMKNLTWDLGKLLQSLT